MPVFIFDASGKGTYGLCGDMVDVVGRWMHGGGQGGYKMEADDGGRMGHPSLFPLSA